jgi:hypothetical protein
MGSFFELGIEIVFSIIMILILFSSGDLKNIFRAKKVN